MNLPNQVNPTIRAITNGIQASTTNARGVTPAACCSNNPDPDCDRWGRITCPSGFTCRELRFCYGQEFCRPVALCTARNFTIGFG
jgi:hypothetical protein